MYRQPHQDPRGWYHRAHLICESCSLGRGRHSSRSGGRTRDTETTQRPYRDKKEGEVRIPHKYENKKLGPLINPLEVVWTNDSQGKTVDTASGEEGQGRTEVTTPTHLRLTDNPHSEQVFGRRGKGCLETPQVETQTDGLSVRPGLPGVQAVVSPTVFYDTGAENSGGPEDHLRRPPPTPVPTDPRRGVRAGGE